MRRYRLQGFVLILTLASLLLLGLAPHAHGDGDKEYHWDYIAVDITVLPDGDLDIVETQRYVFTEGTFTFASLPTTAFAIALSCMRRTG